MVHPLLGLLFIFGMLFLAVLVIGYECNQGKPKRQMTPEEEKQYEIKK